MLGKYLLAIILVICAVPVFAQDESSAGPGVKGTISGHVTDEKGNAVMDAEVFIYKQDNVAIVGSANTNDDSLNTGRFITNRIDTGRYNVQLKYEGYRRLIVNGVPIRENRTTELRLRISPEMPDVKDNEVLNYIDVAVMRKEEQHKQKPATKQKQH